MNQADTSEHERLVEFHSWDLLGLGWWRLTPTGKMWLNTPWKLIYRKRLHVGLLELLVFVMLWGSGEASVVAAFIQRGTGALEIVTFVLVILHLHLLGLSAALYRQKLYPKDREGIHTGLRAAFYMALPALLTHGLGFFIHATSRQVLNGHP